MEQVLILMVGIPGSGKSTKAKELAKTYNAEIFSSDKIRGEILGDENDQTQNNKVFDILHKRVADCLSKGKSAIIDSMNINYKTRRMTLERFEKFKDVKKIAFCMSTTIDDCIERDSERERSVGAEVINAVVKKFEIPYHFEKFDEIIYQDSNYDPNVLVTKLLRIRNIAETFDQMNKHHKYFLGEHQSKTADYIYEKSLGYIDFELMHVAHWHDIGKLFCKSKSAKDDDCHYYGHANYGAYLVYTLFRDVTTAFLVNQHMKPFDWKTEETKEKYRKLYGNELFDKLMLLHEADVYASGTTNKPNILPIYFQTAKQVKKSIMSKIKRKKLIEKYEKLGLKL